MNRLSPPTSKKFDEKAWTEAEVTDEVDRALRESGSLIAQIIRGLTSYVLFAAHDRVLLRALVAHANHQTVATHRRLIDSLKRADPSSVGIDTVLSLKEEQTGGSLGELTDGLGDSFVHALREAMVASRERMLVPDKLTWQSALEKAIDQGFLANRWYLAWFYWMEALWLDAKLASRAVSEWLVTYEESYEKIRVISVWRRNKRKDVFDAQVPYLDYLIRVASTKKTLQCKLGNERLMLSARIARKSEAPWAARIQNHALFPQYILSPRVLDVTLHLPGQQVLVRDAISFHSTLSALFFECFDVFPKRTSPLDTLPRDALCVSVANLIHVVCELTDIDEDKVKALVDSATFTGAGRQTLWSRPLVFAGKDDRYLFLPALKSNSLRTVNSLIDQYAGDNGRKGRFFQEYAREEIARALNLGPLIKVSWLSERAVQTEAGDIDICLILSNTVLIIEVKYMQAVVDAHECWRASQMLAEAVEQIEKKIRLISAEKDSFFSMLHERYGAPVVTQEASVIPLILTSDSFHAGFPVNGICVADIPILAAYLENLYSNDEPVIRGISPVDSVKLYDDVPTGLRGIRAYLERPEIIQRLLGRLVSRKLVYQTDLWNDDKQLNITVESLDVGPDDNVSSDVVN